MTKDVAGGQMADAIADPTSVFNHPREVVGMDQLPKRDKLAILNSWKELEEASAQAAENSSVGGETAMLQSVKRAIADIS